VLAPDVNYVGWTLMLIGGVLFTLRLPGCCGRAACFCP
jgi:hypothetical protein